MNQIKMLALDLDDTLLRSDLTISFRTRSAIKKAEAAGVVVVLASGRIPNAMEEFARILGLHKRPGYLVCNNGAIIQESHTGNIIYEVRLPAEAARIAYDLADAEGFPVQIYEDGIIYVSRSNEFADQDVKLTGLRQVVVENFRAMIASGCSKLLIPGDPMILKPLEIILKTYLDDEANLFTSKPYFLEILPKDTDKGSALAIVAERLGISRESVLAVGDSMNDEAMLKWAGRSVAMVNGDERIKAIASVVSARTNDDDGVADIIERYILGKEPFPG
ncbi:Cof-type HAD-IIB family hydrolase [Breznakiella homolactica]|uniref:HAD family phosphatase n=1 Tax=Breznakiella homolactica TaxID=2798577 RepID=A0A7T7XN45_9SPIR|nr:Cof-type HAD-IIB family hydrolase [Breznakiella homolactica]QQO09399.1 Cof-type HAD-IIB family hydrolase [Breznakiella homolactica]